MIKVVMHVEVNSDKAEWVSAYWKAVHMPAIIPVGSAIDDPNEKLDLLIDEWRWTDGRDFVECYLTTDEWDCSRDEADRQTRDAGWVHFTDVDYDSPDLHQNITNEMQKLNRNRVTCW